MKMRVSRRKFMGIPVILIVIALIFIFWKKIKAKLATVFPTMFKDGDGSNTTPPTSTTV